MFPQRDVTWFWKATRYPKHTLPSTYNYVEVLSLRDYDNILSFSQNQPFKTQPIVLQRSIPETQIPPSLSRIIVHHIFLIRDPMNTYFLPFKNLKTSNTNCPRLGPHPPAKKPLETSYNIHFLPKVQLCFVPQNLSFIAHQLGLFVPLQQPLTRPQNSSNLCAILPSFKPLFPTVLNLLQGYHNKLLMAQN